MDDARALLDSLMGGARNAGKEERKKDKNKGLSFTKDSVCKFFLVGFCPEHEDLFHNTRRDLGKCTKSHFEISKEEFNANPDKAKYEAQYRRELLAHLKDIIRRCDDWGAKERQKNEFTIQKATDEGGNEVAKGEIAKLNETASKLIAEAEDLASAGDVAGSRVKLDLSEQYKKKAEDWKEKYKNTVPEVCEICGLTKENDAGADKGKVFSHSMGKVHQGFLLIRKWYAEIKSLVDGTDAARQADLKEKGDEEQAKERETSFRFEGEDRKKREDREDRRDRRDDRDRRDRDGDRGGRRRDDGDDRSRRREDDYDNRKRRRDDDDGDRSRNRRR